jgi:hypothetical protein
MCKPLLIAVISTREQIESFLRKVEFGRRALKEAADCFPMMNHLHEFASHMSDVLSDITKHLPDLHVTVNKYFPPTAEGIYWLRNPCMFPLTDQILLTKQYEDLIAFQQTRI